MHGLLPNIINFTILVGVLSYYLRAPLRSFVGTRHATIRDDLQRVTAQLRQARSNYEEFSAKLKAIDHEITALRTQAKQDAASMRSKVLVEAKHLSETIVVDARANAQGLYTELKHDLRRDFSNKLLERAEQLLRERLTSDDRVRIRQEFSQQVGRAQ